MITDLDKIFAFRLSDKWLQFRRGEGVYKASLRDDEEEDLGAGQDTQLVGL